MAKRAKRVIHTKQEVAAAMAKSAEFKAKMQFIKEKFWPALCSAATSVEDANMLLSGFNNQIMQSFLALMKERTMDSLRLQDMLSKDSPKYLENLALIELFKDQSIFDAKDYIEGMKGEIQVFIRDENENRPLSALKTKWADELMK